MAAIVRVPLSPLMALVAALAVVACGADEPAPAPAPLEGSERPEEPTAAEPEATLPGEDGPAAGASAGDGAQGGPDRAAGPAGCTYEAPPGRLGDDTVALRLGGVSCEEGRRAARAVALGQPAGANLTVSPAGFSCEPSTSDKGVNVTYTCSGEAGEVIFEVVWSDPGA